MGTEAGRTIQDRLKVGRDLYHTFSALVIYTRKNPEAVGRGVDQYRDLRARCNSVEAMAIQAGSSENAIEHVVARATFDVCLKTPAATDYRECFLVLGAGQRRGAYVWLTGPGDAPLKMQQDTTYRGLELADHHLLLHLYYGAGFAPRQAGDIAVALAKDGQLGWAE